MLLNSVVRQGGQGTDQRRRSDAGRRRRRSEWRAGTRWHGDMAAGPLWLTVWMLLGWTWTGILGEWKGRPDGHRKVGQTLLVKL